MEAPGRARSMVARAARPTSFCLAAEPLYGTPGGGRLFGFKFSSRPHRRKFGVKRFLVVREVAGAVSGVALFWATSLEKIFGSVIAIISFRPGGWTQQSAAEMCYPFGREHGRHRAVKRREFIALLGDDACDRFIAFGAALLTPPPGRDRLLKSCEDKSGTSANTKLLAAETPRKSSIWPPSGHILISKLRGEFARGGRAWHSAYAMFGAIRLRTALSMSSCTTIP